MKNPYNKMKKKGVSPVIATILLIALVVVIGIIIFTWFKGLTGESITKFDGQNVKIVCNDVRFDASYSGDTLTVSNLGNIPIYDFDVKKEGSGSFVTDQASLLLYSSWDAKGLNQGGIASGNVPDLKEYEKITLIPILRGINEDGIEKNQACEERHGETIFT